LSAFAAVIDKQSNSFQKDGAAWGPESDNAKALAKLLGGTLTNLSLLSVSQQASEAWLGGGENSGAAKILKATAEFLKDQKKITAVLPSYAAFVTPDYLQGAAAASN
jgi:taurine transport system substrate-binding protein